MRFSIANLLLLACAVAISTSVGAWNVDASDSGGEFPVTGAAVAAAPALVDEVADALARCVQMRKASAASTRSRAESMTPARFIKPPDPDEYYPYAEKVQGHQALLQLEFLIDALGNPRFVHVTRVLAPVNSEDFSAATVRLVREARMVPASAGGQPLTSWKQIRVKYLFGAHDRMGNILSDEKLDEYVAKARRGDLNAQMVVYYLDSVATAEVGIPPAEYFHYLAQSALAGERSAELTVAEALSPSACTKPASVQKLLHDQAWHGYSAAELLLAAELLESNDPAATHDISVLLHGAANSKDPFVQLWATGILATAPKAELRDPAFALASAQVLKETSDPDVLEALAAAEAASGQFDAALKTEDQALDRAARLHWNDAQLRARRAAYQAGQAWVGYLCDCTQLVPGEAL
jgi:hypothetical protein